MWGGKVGWEGWKFGGEEGLLGGLWQGCWLVVLQLNMRKSDINVST